MQKAEKIKSTTATRSHAAAHTQVHAKVETGFFAPVHHHAGSSPLIQPFFQPKLNISQPGDPYEREADAMADQVMRMQEPSPVVNAPVANAGVAATPVVDEGVQRKEEEPEETAIQPKFSEGNIPAFNNQPFTGSMQAKPALSDSLMVNAKGHLVQRTMEGEDEPLQRQAETEEQIQPRNYTTNSQAAGSTKGRAPPAAFSQQLHQNAGGGQPLDSGTRQFMESRFHSNFEQVRIHTGPRATELSTHIQAQAFTHGPNIYFNAGRYQPDTGAGRHLLAHELTHTIQQGAATAVRPFLKVGEGTAAFAANNSAHKPPVPWSSKTSSLPAVQPAMSKGSGEGLNKHEQVSRQRNSAAGEDSLVQTKPEAGANPVRPELLKAVAYAQSQVGKVDANKQDAEGNRVGWRHLVDYFKTAMGPDKVIAPGGHQTPGSVLEENIRVKGKPIKAQKPNQNDPKVQVDRDAMPSWCGIFVFWSLNKGGVPMPKWTMGGNAVKLKAAYGPSHIPRPGDIAYFNTNSHYAIVDRTEPAQAPASERRNVRVYTVNGNTAGQDNLGGQVQIKSHALSHWDGFFNPLYGIEDKLPANPAEITEAELQQIAGLAAEANHAGQVESKPAPVTDYPPASPPTANALLPLPAQVPEQQNGLQQEAAVKTQETPIREQAPKSPADDPAFQQVKAGVGTVKKTQQQHDTAEHKQVAAQNAATIPHELDVNSQAQYHQVGAMDKQQPQPFNEDAFKTQLQQRIQAALPKTDEETVDRYKNKEKGKKKMEEARSGMRADVAAEKQKADYAIATTAAAAPDTAVAVPKPHQPMQNEEPGAKPWVPEAQTAAPKPKTDAEISLEKEAVALDTQMADNKVTEGQLANSNEPAFTTALESKKNAQTEARNTPNEYRAVEQPQLAKAQKEAQANVMGGLEGMHNLRKGLFGQVDGSKNNTKNKDEEKRKEIAGKLQGIYNTTKKEVEDKLTKLETNVTTAFDAAATAANAVFEKNVNKRLDDHYGWTTVDDTIREAFAGLSPEIDRIFREEKKLFVDSMDTAINSIAKTVATELNAAIKRINDGKKEADTYWNSLSPEMQKIGETARQEMNGKFEELEQSVHQKHEHLVDKLSQKYIDHVGKLEETFNKIKDSKKGWLAAAFDAIAGVIKTIIQLTEMLFETLVRVAQVIGSIIEDPIGFLSNMVQAIKQGLGQFVANLALHLKKGLFEWLLGAMPPGIQFPDKWDLTGIFTFVMQIIGLTWANIRQRAVKKLGEPVVSALEEVFEIFQIIRKEGLAGLWKYIKDKVGNLQVLIIDAIKQYIMEKVIMAGVEWVIGLLNPAGAFIKACKAIYSIVKFFIDKGKQILDFVNTVIDSIALIVAGNLSQAANWIEQALARLIPLVIGFLASLLGLGDIAAKVQKIITAIQSPINKAIDWVLDKAVVLAKKLGLDKVAKSVKGSVDKTKNWAKDKAQKGKEKVKETAAKVLDWLGIRKLFKLKDGKKHEIYFASKENPSAKVMIASDPLTLEAILLSGMWMTYKLSKATKNKLKAEGEAIDALRPKQNVTTGKQIQIHFNNIAQALTAATGVDVPATQAKSTGSRGSGTKLIGEGVKVHPLSLNPGSLAGSPPTVDSEMGEELKARYPNMFVAGHLLNDNLHGPGNERWNLVPLTQKANSNMKTKIEGPVKKKVLSEGAVVNMTVTVAFKAGALNEASADYPEGQMPDSVSVQVEELEHDGSTWKPASPQPAWAKHASQKIDNDTRNIAGFGGAGPRTINPNTSDEQDLARLAYIGKEKAKAIVDFRVPANLPKGRTKYWFTTVDDLLMVPGIGQGTVDAIKKDTKTVSFRF